MEETIYFYFYYDGYEFRWTINSLEVQLTGPSGGYEWVELVPVD